MKTTNKISRGVLKDFIVLNFAGACLEVSLQKHDDAIGRNHDNSNYKLNKRIDRRIATLRTKTEEVLKSIGNACNKSEAEYGTKGLQKVGALLHFLEAKDINMNLELVALNILFVNFTPNERKNQTLHEDYLFFTKSENYLDENADLIGSTLEDSTETDMFYLAYECIAKLKG